MKPSSSPASCLRSQPSTVALNEARSASGIMKKALGSNITSEATRRDATRRGHDAIATEPPYECASTCSSARAGTSASTAAQTSAA